MTVALPTLLILILATWQTVEVARHSDLCAGLRARAEAGTGLAARIFACPWCLSVWVGGAVALVGTLPIAATAAAAGPTAAWVVDLVQCAIVGLAVARGANLGNDLCYTVTRTPKADRGLTRSKPVLEDPRGPRRPRHPGRLAVRPGRLLPAPRRLR